MADLSREKAYLIPYLGNDVSISVLNKFSDEVIAELYRSFSSKAFAKSSATLILGTLLQRASDVTPNLAKATVLNVLFTTKDTETAFSDIRLLTKDQAYEAAVFKMLNGKQSLQSVKIAITALSDSPVLFGLLENFLKRMDITSEEYRREKHLLIEKADEIIRAYEPFLIDRAEFKKLMIRPLNCIANC